MVGRKEFFLKNALGNQLLWPLFSDCPTLCRDVFTLPGLPAESSTNMWIGFDLDLSPLCLSF